MFGWLRRAPSRPTEQQREIANALADYPPYTPPPWWPTDSIEHAAYTRFFLENRERRLEALRIFLAKFNVAPDLDDAGSVWSAYHRFEAAWVDRLLGLNVMFDLGVYCGEWVLRHNPKLKWQCLRGPEHNVAHLVLGKKNQAFFDPVRWVYVMSKNIFNEKDWDRRYGRRPGRPHTKEDELYRRLQWQAVP